MVDLNKRNIVLSPVISHINEIAVSVQKNLKPGSKTRISSSNQNKPQDTVPNLYALIGPFNDHMSKVALLAAKSVDWSIRNFIAPDLAVRLEGGGLMMLGTMVSSIDTTSGSNKTLLVSSSSSSNDSNSKTNAWTNSVDRDLLLLLDGETTGDTQRPMNFHLDANPAEIVRATKPLLAMFNRAADLLVQYPGNELLLQVCKLSAVINDFHISTTLGKVNAYDYCFIFIIYINDY